MEHLWSSRLDQMVLAIGPVYTTTFAYSLIQANYPLNELDASHYTELRLNSRSNTPFEYQPKNRIQCWFS